jgi:hypothetical protein
MMRDYIQRWTAELMKRPEKTIASCVEVTGERHKHVGPKIEYASVRVSLEPADEFEVVDEVEQNTELKQMGYPDWFVFGLLDILMTAESMPLTKIKIVLKNATYDRIDSSPRAFLEAGRDAGQKIRATIEKAKCKYGTS